MSSLTKKSEPIAENDPNAGMTPMMRQYQDIKDKYPDYLLFYRMGDFFELFYEDAKTASKALDIVLTRRGKSADGNDVLMCGVPIHAYESYLSKLIRLGFKVAICEQTESPEEARQKRGYKAVVNREVIRVVTPGTLTEDNLLDAGTSNYLLALNNGKDRLSLAWCDISIGEINYSTTLKDGLLSEIERIAPKEIIINDEILSNRDFSDFISTYRKILSSHAKSFFDSGKGERKIKNIFAVSSLESFGKFEKDELGSLGALLEYIEITQVNKVPRLSAPKRSEDKTFLEIDAASMRNLEIFRSTADDNNSLFNLLNQTNTNAGARLLQKFLARPLINIKQIEARLEAVEFFLKNAQALSDIRNILKTIPDFERIISRIYLKRSNPRDIAVLRDGLKSTLQLSQVFAFAKNIKLPALIKENLDNIFNFDSLLNLLNNALVEFPPINLNEGGYVKPDFNAKLDDYRNIKASSEKIKLQLQEKYIAETGVNTLKIKDNNVIGMFIEMTSQNSNKAPASFIHRQTLATAVRYTTDELRKVENEIINAASYAINLENEIYAKLCEEIILFSEKIISTAAAISYIDILCSFATLASENNYIRPEISDSSELQIENGRHPIVECALKKISKEKFSGNDLKLSDEEKIWLLTGPNMSGKSTFLRQNALIIVMAQVGCFVPADKTKIGIVDKIFSRVGASDNIAKGHSTFMVEMIETATILNNATDRSFIILDEIGRGTATFDGLAIAWAVLEFIHDNLRCRCLFATHYHELNSLKVELPNLACHTTQIREWKGDIIFMHKIIAGQANQSYGIHVAKLAGIPKSVSVRADEILQILAKQNKGNETEIISANLPLFTNGYKDPIMNYNGTNQPSHAIVEKLFQLEIDNLTPIQALNLLVELKKNIQS